MSKMTCPRCGRNVYGTVQLHNGSWGCLDCKKTNDEVREALGPQGPRLPPDPPSLKDWMEFGGLILVILGCLAGLGAVFNHVTSPLGPGYNLVYQNTAHSREYKEHYSTDTACFAAAEKLEHEGIYSVSCEEARR